MATMACNCPPPARIVAAAAAATEPQHAPGDLGQDDDRTEHDRREREELRVAIFQVGDFVSDDALQLIAVEPVHQTGGDGNGAGFRRMTDRQRVRRGSVDQIDLRHVLQPGSQPHLVDDVEQARAVVAVQFPGGGCVEQHRFGAGHVDRHLDAPEDQRDADAEDRATRAEDVSADSIARKHQAGCHQRDQRDGAAFVGPDLLPHDRDRSGADAMRGQNLTWGAWRSASSLTSKKSRLPKPNVLAMRFVGKTWMLVL